jgi:hypothetical protein
VPKDDYRRHGGRERRYPSKHPGNMCGVGGNQDIARSGRLGQDNNRYNDDSEARHLTTVRVSLANEPTNSKLPP